MQKGWGLRTDMAMQMGVGMGMEAEGDTEMEPKIGLKQIFFMNFGHERSMARGQAAFVLCSPGGNPQA